MWYYVTVDGVPMTIIDCWWCDNVTQWLCHAVTHGVNVLHYGSLMEWLCVCVSCKRIDSISATCDNVIALRGDLFCLTLLLTWSAFQGTVSRRSQIAGKPCHIMFNLIFRRQGWHDNGLEDAAMLHNLDSSRDKKYREIGMNSSWSFRPAAHSCLLYLFNTFFAITQVLKRFWARHQALLATKELAHLLLILQGIQLI